MHEKQIYSVEVSNISFNGPVFYFYTKKKEAEKFAENARSIGFPSVVTEYLGKEPLFVYEG